MSAKAIIPAIALLGAIASNAATLTPDEALARVMKESDAMRAPARAVVAQPRLIHTTVGDDGEPAVYIFTTDSREGSIVVSADDVAAPLLGYCDTPADGELPTELRWWLGQYAAEIEAARSGDAPRYVEPAAPKATATRKAIAPLVNTRWDQGAPYNNDCPSVSQSVIGNGKAPTGCVATAMAQVMKYFGWPAKGTGTGSATVSGGSQQSMNLNVTFDWSNMTDTYAEGSYTATQASAVALLMKACGYSVAMNYTTSASGAQSTAIPGALINNFGYDSGAALYRRDYYGRDEWEEMIYNNLANVGPVIYTGASNVGGGHAFVCDGYSADGYFHFNWGWSGMSDGYFLLSMLKPTNLGTGAGNGDYTNNQGALLGIKPSDGTDSPRKYTFCIDELTQAYPGSGTYFNILGSFVNRSPYTVTGQFVYQIYNADGTQKVTSVTVDAQVPRNWGIDIVTGMTRSATQMQGRISGLADGTYRLYPAVLVDGVEYPFQSPATIAGYVLITSSNGKITDATIPSPGELVAENLDTNGDFFVGSDIKISGTARFTGDGDTNATVKAVLLNADMSVRAYSNENYTLNFTPESTDFEFISSWFYDKGLAVEPGEYKFGIAISENGLFKVLGSCPVTVNARVPKPTFKTPVTVSVDNADAVDPMNIKINLSVEGLTGVVYRDFRLSVFKVGVFGAAEVNETLPIYVSAGQTTTESITISMRGAIPGERYFVHALVDNAGRTEYVTDTDVNKRVYFTIGNQSGISDVEVDEDAPVEYFNLQGMPVSADNLTPGVYIRRQGSKVAKILVR